MPFFPEGLHRHINTLHIDDVDAGVSLKYTADDAAGPGCGAFARFQPDQGRPNGDRASCADSPIPAPAMGEHCPDDCIDDNA